MWISVLPVTLLPSGMFSSMLTDRDHLMTSYRGEVRRDPLRAIAHFDIGATLAHPDFLARILPRHRIAASSPGNIRIPRDLAQLIVHVRVCGTPAHHLH